MAHAYTPGLMVTEKTLVKKERRLPLKGEVVSKVGDRVRAESIVAKTYLPGEVHTVNVAGILGIMPEDINEYMVKGEGDEMGEGEVIAQSKGFFGLFKAMVKSPTKGTVESISKITGQVILREPPEPVEVDAYVDGEVVEVYEKEGAGVETVATFIQGIFGVGGETRGEMLRISDSAQDVLTPEDIGDECRGKILIGGSLVTADAVKKAIAVGARGIVVGGIDDRDLKGFLGYDIGVAITGSEDIGLTLIITEGFGKMAMADKTYRLLVAREGERASINGATQIRAGVMRPEVVIPLDTEIRGTQAERGSTGLEIGSPIRVIREPFFGSIGKVTSLPSELQLIETEAKVRILEVELEGRTRVLLPRANVEMIEE